MLPPETLLRRFVRESNSIENIHREPTHREMAAHEALLEAPEITIKEIESFVSVVTNGKGRLRGPGQNVAVYDRGMLVHAPPAGGRNITIVLERLVERMNKLEDPFTLHHEYETLHPFTDGNGRSGRALWLWGHLLLGGSAERAFLHQWYLQSLADHRA